MCGIKLDLTVYIYTDAQQFGKYWENTMQFNPIKLLLSQTERKKYSEYKKSNFKLFMTLVVRDEEDIIEQNIRFHSAMGVDGFIVLSHNSVDNTNDILERLKQENLVNEISYKDTPDHKHSVWVNEMVKVAKNKYKADWIINADADEFFYSRRLNLKKGIAESEGANAIWVDSFFYFPQERAFNSFYFVKKPLQIFEAEQLGILNNPRYDHLINSIGVKTLHKTKNFISVRDGNHSTKMRNRIKSHSADIRLYHYHIRGYKGLEEKVKRWEKSIFYLPAGKGEEMKAIVKCYQQGKLMEEYEKKYGKEMLNFALSQGIVVPDPSVYNFMKHKNIIG